MSTRSILIPFFLVALAGLGRPMPQGLEPRVQASAVQGVGAPERAATPLGLAAAEREELQRASAASPRLEALRGGEVSDHDLNVALLVVGVVLIILII